MNDLQARIKATARSFGFDLVGVTSGKPVSDALVRLESWCERGFAGSMHYMDRDPPQRATPKTIHKTAGSVLCFAVPYWHPAPAFQHEQRFGRVARYAWGLDYHDVIIPRLRELATALAADNANLGRTKVASDYSPILERAFAARAGLGFFGKNTCLLLPRRGSWFFLAELIVEAELERMNTPSDGHCGTCNDCIPACPTDAFPEPYVLDARKCISYLTIESQEPIPRSLRTAMGAWIFGCDVCQDVCPFNRFDAPPAWPEFAPDRGVGMHVDLADVLSMRTDAEFDERFRGTPLQRPGRAGLLRNAAVVARNIDCMDCVPALEACLKDPEALVRTHALWALEHLAPNSAHGKANELVAGDSHEWVRKEAAAVLSTGTHE